MEKKDLKQAIENLKRARRFMDLASNNKDNGQDYTDLLGAAVVFLHAALEEHLRAIALQEWPNLGEAQLVQIISKYSRLDKRNVKLSLKTDIAKNLEKTYKELLIEELRSYLYQHANFNCLEDIEIFLEDANIPSSALWVEIGGESKKNISALINSRHLVAHQANCENLDTDKVLVWGKSLQDFLVALSKQLGVAVDYQENLKKIRYL